MKIRNGRRSVKDFVPSEADEEIRRAIFAQAKASVLRLSRGRMDKIARAAQAAAVEEAYQVIVAIDRVIEANYGVSEGIRGSSLQDQSRSGLVRAGSGIGVSGVSADGFVPWKDLSPEYGQRKAREFGNKGTFDRTGALFNAFARYRTQIIDGRFGGVTVKVSPEDLDNFPRAQENLNAKIALGKIKISIFPNISRSLLPGLASRRWSDISGTNGSMEQATMPSSILKKLAPEGGGGKLPYRPLVLPITQFFMLIRIPNAIAARIRPFVNSYSGGVREG